jgi:hypothetical protein
MQRSAASQPKPYWAFVSNPKRWDIEKFLRSGKTDSTWGITARNVNQNKNYRAEQFAIVRVGAQSQKTLKAGIYAICKILPRPESSVPIYTDIPQSPVYEGAGEPDEFSREAARAKGWPTVRVRYVRKYFERPLLIENLPSDLESKALGKSRCCIEITGEDFRKNSGMSRGRHDRLT